MIVWCILTLAALGITILLGWVPMWLRMIGIGVIAYVIAIGITSNLRDYPILFALIVGPLLAFTTNGAWRFFRDPSLVSIGPRTIWFVVGVLVWPIGLGLALIEIAHRYDVVRAENHADSIIRQYETQIGIGTTTVAPKSKQFQSTTI